MPVVMLRMCSKLVQTKQVQRQSRERKTGQGYRPI